jgi:hypothetical protein
LAKQSGDQIGTHHAQKEEAEKDPRDIAVRADGPTHTRSSPVEGKTLSGSFSQVSITTCQYPAIIVSLFGKLTFAWCYLIFLVCQYKHALTRV